MTVEETEALIAELEQVFQPEVQEALDETADEFAAAVDSATELVAAAFSVSRIRSMWAQRVPALVARLRSFAGRAAEATAEELGEEAPSEDVISSELEPYVEGTTALLNETGEDLARAATESLAEGVAEGESLDELKARMRELMSDSGSQLGPVRAARISTTETTRAWNAGVLAGAQALTGAERPLVKQWQTSRDEKVRAAHKAADGQLQLLDDAFDVGGTPMQYPGDPSAPADLTINCRCILRTQTAPAGRDNVSGDDLSAAADVHTGAMIALVPSAEDAARLALSDGEPAGQLHVTLAYLGEAADWDPEEVESLASRLSVAASTLSALDAKIFGAAHWNPQSDSPAWVWSVGDGPDSPDGLATAHRAAWWEVRDGSPTPAPHTPWVAHMTAVYDVADRLAELSERVGPVTFDRLRLAVGGTHYDFPLGTAETIEDEPMEDVPMIATWTTPDEIALAFENQQTGDGRVFAPGALYWSGDGPWPLQYADEMQGGHDGAQLAGAIVGMSRVGDRIPGHGLLYLTTDAGVEATMLLAQGAPLGVSVDLDDVDMELVDASDEGRAAYRAKLLTASVMPTPEGGFLLTGETAPTMTASEGSTLIASRKVAFVISANGTVPGGLLDLVAAAGDPDAADGTVVDSMKSGEYLMRITRGRIRGATLVSIPAYADARIVLDNPDMFASYTDTEVTAAIKSTTDYDKVLRHVRSSSSPVGAARVAQALKMPVVAAQRILAQAAHRGEVVRLTYGLYTDKTTSAKADHLMNDNLVASEDVALEELAASVGDGGDDELTNGMVASAWTAMRDLPPMPSSWFREPTVEELPPGGPGVNYSNGRIFGWVAQAGEPHAGYARKVTIDTLGRIDTTHFLRQRFTLDNGESVKAGAFTMNAGHHRDGAECETSSCQFDDTRTVAGIVTVGMNERGLWFSGAAAPWLSEWDRSVFMSTQPSYHLKKGNSGNWQLRAVLAVPVPGHSSPLMASAVVGRAQMALTAAATMAEVEEAVTAEEERQAAEQTPAVDIVASIDYDRLADALVAAGKRAEQREAAEAAELSELLAEASKLDVDSTGTEGA